MKRNFLLLLFAIIICLPTTQAQLLTEVADTTRESDDLDFYVFGGTSIRWTPGYKEMRTFYEGQGFDYLNLFRLVKIGVGGDLGKRWIVDMVFDFSLDIDDPEDVNLGNEAILSLNENKTALHVLMGYRFWEKRYTSLYFQTGFTWQQNKVEMVERLQGEFDFTTANRFVPRGARSIPVFYHHQGAFHAAVKWKLSYPRSRYLGTDQDLQIGFVSALNAKPWSVSPGQSINTPMDRLQYIYMSGTVYFYPRRNQLRK